MLPALLEARLPGGQEMGPASLSLARVTSDMVAEWVRWWGPAPSRRSLPDSLRWAARASPAEVVVGRGQMQRSPAVPGGSGAARLSLCQNP